MTRHTGGTLTPARPAAAVDVPLSDLLRDVRVGMWPSSTVRAVLQAVEDGLLPPTQELTAALGAYRAALHAWRAEETSRRDVVGEVRGRLRERVDAGLLLRDVDLDELRQAATAEAANEAVTAALASLTGDTLAVVDTLVRLDADELAEELRPLLEDLGRRWKRAREVLAGRDPRVAAQFLDRSDDAGRAAREEAAAIADGLARVRRIHHQILTAAVDDGGRVGRWLRVGVLHAPDGFTDPLTGARGPVPTDPLEALVRVGVHPSWLPTPAELDDAAQDGIPQLLNAQQAEVRARERERAERERRAREAAPQTS